MKTLLTFKTLPLEVEFDYIPGEERVNNYGDGSGYPGSPASVEISNIYTNIFVTKEWNFDITSFFEENGLIYKLEEVILENMILLIQESDE